MAETPPLVIVTELAAIAISRAGATNTFVPLTTRSSTTKPLSLCCPRGRPSAGRFAVAGQH